MGSFAYSTVRNPPVDLDTIEVDLRDITASLWPDGKYYLPDDGRSRVLMVEGTVKWCFYAKGWDADAAFTISLTPTIIQGRRARFEFKVPRSQWDECWEAQQAVRRRMVRQYNRET